MAINGLSPVTASILWSVAARRRKTGMECSDVSNAMWPVVTGSTYRVVSDVSSPSSVRAFGEYMSGAMSIVALVLMLGAALTDAGMHSTEGVLEAEAGARRALDWLWLRRRDDWSWANYTAPALLALALTNSSWYGRPPSQPEAQLVAKQLELELVLHLWRHHEAPLGAGHLAQYTLALNAICRDPKNFYGHDLINSLQHHEPQLDYDFAFSSLAVCSSGGHVRKRQLRRLLDIADRVNDHNVDTLSMVLLALSCIVQDHRHRNLEHYVHRPGAGLGRQQQADGGFGSEHSTALAIQALDTGDNESASLWNRTAAISFLLSRQASDGAFGDVGATAEVLLALGPRSLSAIRDVPCASVPDTAVPAPPPSVPVQFVVTSHPATAVSADDDIDNDNVTSSWFGRPDAVTVTYSIWVHANLTESYQLTLRAHPNSTFYNVMLLAARQDPHYQFEATDWPNGHYVHTLAGHRERPAAYYFWLLYQTPELPEPRRPPGNQLITPVGVDGLTVDDGSHYLFWYKKL